MRSDLSNYLDRANIKRVVVSFEGGGDSGGMTQITLYVGGTEPEHAATVNPWSEEANKSAPPEFFNMLEEPIYDRYGGFVSEFSVAGALIYAKDGESWERTWDVNTESWED